MAHETIEPLAWFALTQGLTGHLLRTEKQRDHAQRVLDAATDALRIGDMTLAELDDDDDVQKKLQEAGLELPVNVAPPRPDSPGHLEAFYARIGRGTETAFSHPEQIATYMLESHAENPDLPEELAIWRAFERKRRMNRDSGPSMSLQLEERYKHCQIDEFRDTLGRSFRPISELASKLQAAQ